jgi:hypothetical protein
MIFRVLSLFGLGGAFLIVSPPLRDSLIGGIQESGMFLHDHSPASYIGVGLAALVGAMVWVNRASQAR